MVDHKDYRVLYVSPSYEEIWGQTCERLLKDPTAWIDAIIPEDRERVIAALEDQPKGPKRTRAGSAPTRCLNLKYGEDRGPQKKNRKENV